MSESLYDDVMAAYVAERAAEERRAHEEAMRTIAELTVDDKRRILFNESLEAQMDDYRDFIEMVLWEGHPTGYRDMTDEQVEEEWRDTIEGLDQDEIMWMIYKL